MTKSLVTECINGQTVESTAVGGIKALSMDLESSLTTQAKRNTDFGKTVLVEHGSKKKPSQKYS